MRPPLVIFYISKSNFLYQAINHDLEEGCFTKPKYEKPIAMPLGDAVKGSGACNPGSGVRQPVGGPIFNCLAGTTYSGVSSCKDGSNPYGPCWSGGYPT
jgi:hypothetical protein